MDSQESRNPDDVVVAFIDSNVRGVGSPTTLLFLKIATLPILLYIVTILMSWLLSNCITK
jgi:hypothetical protein